MKALMLSKYEHLEVTDIPEPVCAPDEVLIRVAACGICGSDVHGYDGGSGRRIPPIVMGHEGAGVIEHVGADVKNYNLGERVTFDSTVYCGHCEFCQRGEVNLCDSRQVLGVSCRGLPARRCLCGTGRGSGTHPLSPARRVPFRGGRDA